MSTQAAYCQVEPTHKFFWQEVARRVGSRSAGECFDRVFAAARSPPPAKLSKTKLTVGGWCGCDGCNVGVWVDGGLVDGMLGGLAGL